MNDYLYTLSPFTDGDLVLSESPLLRILQKLERTNRLNGQTVHMYEGRVDAQTYKGSIDAAVVLLKGGFDETLI